MKRNWAYIGWTLFSGTSASNSASPIFIFNRRNSVIESSLPDGSQEVSRPARRTVRPENSDLGENRKAKPRQKRFSGAKRAPRANAGPRRLLAFAWRISRLFGGVCMCTVLAEGTPTAHL